MRLIDSTKLIDALPVVAEDKKISLIGAVADMVMLISEQPVIEAVPVVRCAQCKHFKRNLENDTYCSSVNGLTDPQEDDFCSYGERKEGTE